MKQFKKIIGVFLAGMMLVSLFTVSAFAASDDDTPEAIVFFAGTTTTNTSYATLSEAITAANASTDTTNTIYLLKDAALSTSIGIASNVTLVVPTSSNYQKDSTTGGSNVTDNGDPNGNPYATLTINANVSFTVRGTLLVAGNQQGIQSRTGFRTGDYGQVVLKDGARLNISSGGKLYARGEITGTGTVTANSGSTVYQRFQIADWRGGTASRNAYNAKVFPFNLFSLGGISAKTVYNAGSNLNGQGFFTIYGIGQPLNIPYISNGTSANAPLHFTDDEGSIQFTTNGDLTTIEINGAHIATGNLTFSAFGYSFSSAGLDCPFGYNTKVKLNSGSTLAVDTKLKLLPGFDIEVGSGATINVASGAAMYFYGADAYKSTYFFKKVPDDIPLNWTYSAAATLTNKGGTVNNAGTIASTDPNFDNVDGFKAAESEPSVDILEYNQSTSKTETAYFYLGTPDTSTPTPAA